LQQAQATYEVKTLSAVISEVDNPHLVLFAIVLCFSNNREKKALAGSSHRLRKSVASPVDCASWLNDHRVAFSLPASRGGVGT
jgi:hypothetical protein